MISLTSFYQEVTMVYLLEVFIFILAPSFSSPLVLKLVFICKPNCVSVLMQSIQEDIEKEVPAIQSSDIISFFRVAQFVVSFQYHKIAFSKVRAMGTDMSGFLNYVQW